jgi:hypothetical protein
MLQISAQPDRDAPAVARSKKIFSGPNPFAGAERLCRKKAMFPLLLNGENDETHPDQIQDQA